ncbi:hypothetical protein [Floridanema aerugineum]|uniref:Uncharacterized protein n=1 Tax=Floridaenema aerugineum BLCC-F46 TaxID=3153654 RepID=A0ABV4X399_9CYAN
MTLIIKEKAVFCFTGKQWLNLAQARSITPNGDRVTICWQDGKLQGFNSIESKEILECLQEL